MGRDRSAPRRAEVGFAPRVEFTQRAKGGGPRRVESSPQKKRKRPGGRWRARRPVAFAPQMTPGRRERARRVAFHPRAPTGSDARSPSLPRRGARLRDRRVRPRGSLRVRPDNADIISAATTTKLLSTSTTAPTLQHGDAPRPGAPPPRGRARARDRRGTPARRRDAGPSLCRRRRAAFPRAPPRSPPPSLSRSLFDRCHRGAASLAPARPPRSRDAPREDALRRCLRRIRLLGRGERVARRARDCDARLRLAPACDPSLEEGPVRCSQFKLQRLQIQHLK